MLLEYTLWKDWKDIINEPEFKPKVQFFNLKNHTSFLFGISKEAAHSASFFGSGSKGIAAVKAIAHGLTRGAIAKAQGQTFKGGFWSSFASSGFSVGNKGYGGFMGRTAIMSIVGGTASKLGGGKFANGAVSGAFVHMFNGEGMARSLVNGTLNVVGKVWNSLNTAIGLVYGGVGHLIGLAMGTNPYIKFGYNAIQFINNPFGGVGAITLGNTITYGTRMTDKDIGGYYGLHEEQHTYQGEVLGPLYLPAHILSMTSGLIIDGDVHGSHAFMEVGPEDRVNTRPWP